MKGISRRIWNSRMIELYGRLINIDTVRQNCLFLLVEKRDTSEEISHSGPPNRIELFG